MKYQDIETNTKVVDEVYVVLYNNGYVSCIQGVFADIQSAEQMLKKQEITLNKAYANHWAMTKQQAKEEAKLSISRYYSICTYEVQE